MESIKINGKQYTLVADGYQLREDEGHVIFRPGDVSFEEVEADLRAARSVMVLDDAGEPLVSRSDLVYAGRLTKDSDYVIGTEQVETGVDEDGNPVYDVQTVTGTVMIAEFRQPDLREKYSALEAQMAYLAMMADIDMEV